LGLSAIRTKRTGPWRDLSRATLIGRGGKLFRDERQLTVHAPPDAVFRAVCNIGGGHGWFAADWLWKIRGWMDLLVGGPGLRRGRRDPEMVRYGEALDFWRVVSYERDRRLALRAEMKLPGEALL